MEKQIFLRELLDSDVNNTYLSWFADGVVTSFLEVEGSRLTKQMVLDYIAQGRTSRSYFMYAICLTSNKKHIGNLKVGPINQKHLVSDLVCVIGDKNYWGKGLATEAIALGNLMAFEKYGIRKLHGQIYADNIGSIKAYCKAGWIIEGIIKGRYWQNEKPMDQVLVSCNNPLFFDPPGQDDYNITKLKEMIAFRESFLNQ